MGLRLAGQPSHPLQPGLRRSVRQTVERAEEADLVGRRTHQERRRTRRAGGWARTCRTSAPSSRRTRRRRRAARSRASAGPTRSSCAPTAKADSWPPSLDGAFPEHYEPFESPATNLLSSVQNNPVAKRWDIGDANPLGHPRSYPYVLTTYRLTEHHAAGTSRHVPWLSELFTGHFAEIGVEMAKSLGIANGDMITVETPRGRIRVRAMVTERIKPFVIDGKHRLPGRHPVALGLGGRDGLRARRHHQRPCRQPGRSDDVHPGVEGAALQRAERR